MLHEILLALAGVRSPIWDLIKDGKADAPGSLREYVSPPEKDMLMTLKELADLHIKIRDASTEICKLHSSTICRAVSNCIAKKHLAAFQQHILHVEASIMVKDATFVGAYNLVPLSTILIEFEPWTRRLRWLWKVTQLMCRGFLEKGQPCSGKDIMQMLQVETHTGYDDLRDMSTDLLTLAQTSWLRSLSPWIMYGQIPKHGSDDFVVYAADQPLPTSYSIRSHLVPDFVTPEAASSLLAIGQAFNRLLLVAAVQKSTGGPQSICHVLLPSSLKAIQELQFPIQPIAFEKAMDTINDNISQTALAKVLPMDLIQNFLYVVKRYLLFVSGDFAFTLIRNLEDGAASNEDGIVNNKPLRKLGHLKDLTVNGSERAAILSKTWADVTSTHFNDEADGELNEQAARWIKLAVTTKRELPLNTVMGGLAALRMGLPLQHPLSFFVSTEDLGKYEDISAYLLSLRRGEIQAAKLWKSTSHRRCHPTPLGPPLSATRFGQQALAARRQREDIRTRKMRLHWSTISRARFILAELGNYLHGEVIEKSWARFEAWLTTRTTPYSNTSAASSRPATSSRDTRSRHSMSTRPGSSAHAKDSSARTDPRTLAKAHTKYLDALYSALLINHLQFVSALLDMLTNIDHYVALFGRLQTIWQGLDLQEDEGVMDAFSNHAQDEDEVVREMKRTNSATEHSFEAVINHIKQAEKDRDLADMTTGVAGLGFGGNDNEFVPWKARTLDRLIMKVEFVSGMAEDPTDDELVKELYDE